MSNFLARYRAGEHEAVWRELQLSALDNAVRSEAEEVASEIMRRVARNADRLAQRLVEGGWEALTGELRASPDPDDSRFVQEVEQLTGAPVPISLAVFWKNVGGIDFVWNYKLGKDAPRLCGDIPLDEADPLYVDAARYLFYRLAEWREEPPNLAAGEAWDLELAPDYLHKANISGGAPYGVALPAHAVDFAFKYERHDLDFVDYLRLAFRWGGFPGLENYSRAEVTAFVEAMTVDLEPF
jgi:hypothetical protein